MMQLRLLGTLDLRDDMSGEVNAVLRRPKLVALLAYLAAARPFGFHRRDALVAFLWPDLDNTHARNALRQAAHGLREHLGHDVLVARGEEELGIDDRRLSCDVRRFSAALESNEDQRGVDSYQGPLLSGFHLSDVPEFERWLDDEREHLRRQACDALERLTQQARTSGNIMLATQCARRLTQIAPFDERAAQRLIELLDATGDRAGALRTYDEFESRVARDLHVQPSVQTRDVVRRLRESTSPANSAALASATARATATKARMDEHAVGWARTIEQQLAETRKASRVRVSRTSFWSAAAVVAGIAVAAIAGFQPARQSLASASQYRIAVLPFSYQGDSAYSYLGHGFSQMLTASLDGAGPYSTVPFATVARFQTSKGQRSAQECVASDIAKQFDSRMCIFGSVVESRGRLRVTAQLVDFADTDAMFRSTAEGGEDELFRLVDKVSAGILAHRLDGPKGERLRLAASTTESLEALKEYLRGESALRRGQFPEALQHYRRAVELDSTFALARHRAGMLAVEDWTRPRYLMQQDAEAALRHSARLPMRERMLIGAFAARMRGELRTFMLYRDVVGMYVNDIDALLELGEILSDQGQAVAASPIEARQLFERVLALDPGNMEAREYLYGLAMSENDYEQAAAFARGSGANDARWYLPVPLIMRQIVGTPAEREHGLRELQQARMNVAKWVAMGLTASEAPTDIIESVVRSVANRPDAPFQVLASWILADVAVARGRWTDADREFDRLLSSDSDRAFLIRGVYLGSGAYPADSRVLKDFRNALVQWHAPPNDTLVDPHRHTEAYARSQLKLYVRGLLEVRLGELDAALQTADDLERLGRSRAEIGLVTRLVAELRARVMRARGEPLHALALLERSDLGPDYPTLHMGWTYSPALDLSSQRWLRAELLAQLGRDRDAIGWYQSFMAPNINTSFFVPAVHLRLAQLHERLHEQTEARRHAQRLVDMWATPDAEWLPLRAEASRIASTGGLPNSP